ncbi:MAG: hypothetical protein L0Z62_24340 [Gemmataceae bacterium]|nr:hypothetical protein [Gemmataceae bacterium]
MEIPVLIEPIPGAGFRARGGEPFALTAEGLTPEDALGKLREQLQDRLAAGARVVPLEVPDGHHPLARWAGMFKDDPLFQEVLQLMAERRQQADDDPDYL